MEENIPMFNNKILGILIAVVVTATVLIPICNAFSDGGDSPTPLADGDGGIRMSKIDWNDHSKTYTVTPIYYEDNNFENYLFGLDRGWMGEYFYNPLFADNPTSVTIYWDSEENKWLDSENPTYGSYYSWEEEDGHGWMVDENGSTIVYIAYLGDDEGFEIEVVESDTPNNNSNGGISSTLIGIIPVFVILAILGSVAYMLIGKNEIQ